MAFASSKIGAQSAINVPCDLCEEEEDVNWFCKDCGQKLCDRCKKTHLRSNNSRNHIVLSIFEALHVIKQNVDSMCEIHTEPFSFHCRTCTTNICSKCLTQNHKKHDFVDMSEANAEIQKKLNDLLIQKDKEKQQMLENKEALLRYEASFAAYVKECESKVDDRVKAIQKSAEKHGATLKSKLLEIKKKDDKFIASHIEKLQGIENNYSERIALAQQELWSQTHASIIAHCAQSETEIRSLHPISVPVPNQMNFLNFLTQIDDETIHKMVGTFIEENIPSLEPTMAGEDDTTMEKSPPPFQNELKLVDEVHVNGLSSHKVLGMCASPHGCVWLGTYGSVFLIDMKVSAATKTLQIIDGRKILFCLYFDCGNIACLNSGDAVVAYGGSYIHVDRFTRDGKRVDFAYIRGDSQLEGIAVSGNQVLVFTKTEYFILSDLGETLKMIKPNVTMSHATITFEGQVILYSEGAFVTINRNDKELEKRGNLGNDIENLQCDQYGNILANKDDSLYFLRPQGTDIQRFRIGHKSFMFCIDNEDHVLILTNEKDGKGKISVFEDLESQSMNF